ncbi:hypothetical protein AVEN_153556-1 [Araneus ventricosus]|uniref:Uncharacterized protein n=1 Tax=Araneus ventricosus TaxID=182803 RepID=A0A4Y2G8L3_ARAVE|nr:hypothetical protein AVEN_153556-1 [Araneus ventricosus]
MKKILFRGDESEKKDDFIEVENHEFTDSDKDEKEELSFDNKDEEETKIEKQTQEDENMKLKKLKKIPKFFESCDRSLIYPGKIQLTGKDKSKWSYIPKSSNRSTASRNIIHFIQAPKDSAKELCTSLESFNYLCVLWRDKYQFRECT